MTKEELIRTHTNIEGISELNWDGLYEAMDEWAKIKAIEFDKWKEDNFLQHRVGKFIQRGYDIKYEGSFTREELYQLYIKLPQ